MASDFGKRLDAFWAALPPNGSAVDFAELDRLFMEHFPDAESGTMSMGELDRITSEIASVSPRDD